MSRFVTHTLRNQGCNYTTLATVRRERGLRLTEISRTIGVPRTYLRALEIGNWQALPVGTYGCSFLRVYANYLGVPAEPLLYQYNKQTKDNFSSTKIWPASLSGQPYPYRRWLLISLGVIIIGYLGWAAWRTFLPPQLTILEPALNTTTTSALINVRGLTQVGTVVRINQELVEVSNEGKFNEQVTLRPGLNTITLVAEKTYSPTVTVTRQVLFNPPLDSSTNNNLK